MQAASEPVREDDRVVRGPRRTAERAGLHADPLDDPLRGAAVEPGPVHRGLFVREVPDPLAVRREEGMGRIFRPGNRRAVALVQATGVQTDLAVVAHPLIHDPIPARRHRDEPPAARGGEHVRPGDVFEFDRGRLDRRAAGHQPGADGRPEADQRERGDPPHRGGHPSRPSRSAVVAAHRQGRDRVDPGTRRRAPLVVLVLQRGGEGRGAPDPVAGELLERMQERGVHVGRYRAALPRDRGRVLREDLHERRLRGGRGVRRRAREHLVGDAGQRVHVRPRRQIPVGGRLLGAHVVRSAQREPGLGHASAAGRADRECDPEVGDHRLTRLDQDVLGLDVAVDDAPVVRELQRRRDRLRDAERIRHGELLLAVDPLAQRLPLHEGHDVVEDPALVPRIVEPEDVRVLQVGGRLDLGQEALPADHGGEFGLQDLDRDLAAVLHVLGEVDDGHAALAQALEDAVAAVEGGGEAFGRGVGHGGEATLVRASSHDGPCCGIRRGEGRLEDPRSLP